MTGFTWWSVRVGVFETSIFDKKEDDVGKCMHVSPCACVLNFADVFIYGEGCGQVSSYVFVCACESVCICV